MCGDHSASTLHQAAHSNDLIRLTTSEHSLWCMRVFLILTQEHPLSSSIISQTWLEYRKVLAEISLYHVALTFGPWTYTTTKEQTTSPTNDNGRKSAKSTIFLADPWRIWIVRNSNKDTWERNNDQTWLIPDSGLTMAQIIENNW